MGIWFWDYENLEPNHFVTADVSYANDGYLGTCNIGSNIDNLNNTASISLLSVIHLTTEFSLR